MARVENVTACIMESLETATTMKLQKLLYYCQGWHLAWDGVLLFDAKIEAWANGPVVYEIYELHRGKYWLETPWPPQGDPDQLSRDERESVGAVLANYGTWSGDQLSRKAHQERPWLDARGDLAPTAASRDAISTDVMQEFFGGLLAAQTQ